MKYLKYFESESDMEYHKSVITEILQEYIDEYDVEYDHEDDDRRDEDDYGHYGQMIRNGLFWRFFRPGKTWGEINFKYDLGVVFYVNGAGNDFDSKIFNLLIDLEINPESRLHKCGYEVRTRSGPSFKYFYIKFPFGI